ncbi:MAG: N-acetyltransferase family protein [Pseudomonadota bacterium]
MIRAATPADDAAIAAIWNDVIAQPHITFTTTPKTPADIAALRAAGPVLVTEDATGFACAGPFRGGPGYADVAELSVHLAPAARGQGQGRALVTALEAALPQVAVIVAAISGANPDAVQFHMALGYLHVGTMPAIGDKGGRRFDLILMQKFLPAHPDFGRPQR